MHIGGGHKPNNAKRNQRERWNKRHPEGRKKYSKEKRKIRLEKRLAKIKRKASQP